MHGRHAANKSCVPTAVFVSGNNFAQNLAGFCNEVLQLINWFKIELIVQCPSKHVIELN